MTLGKVISLSLVALLATGCACRTKRVGPDDGQIPVAAAGDILKDVNFAFDSFALTSTAKATLDGNASYLKENADVKVEVEGHADERGTNEYNLALGKKRADSVARYYTTSGIEKSRVSTVSYGEELPLDPRSTEEAWAKNRRAHSKIVK